MRFTDVDIPSLINDEYDMSQFDDLSFEMIKQLFEEDLAGEGLEGLSVWGSYQREKYNREEGIINDKQG